MKRKLSNRLSYPVEENSYNSDSPSGLRHGTQQWPKITIVTPNLNQGRFIEETILSVISQKYPNLEFIIIDGGSSDNSLEVIDKYRSLLTHWFSEADNGMYEAVKKGFERSSGEIMGWLNSDDTLQPGALHTLGEVFTNFNEINWMHGRSGWIDEMGRSVGVSSLCEWNKYDYYQHHYKFINQESTFWRRTLWDKAGGYIDTSLKLAGDLELWNRFFKNDRLYRIEAILGNFRFRSSNQQSLELMREYCEEAEMVLNTNTLTKEELDVLHRILHNPYYHLRKICILKKLYRNYEKRTELLKEIPPILSYERISGKFEFGN